MKVADFLRIGSDNARRGKNLCEELHLTKRELKRQIQLERLAGEAICASTAADKAGYFLPANKAELIDTIRSNRSREKELRRVRKALEKTGKRLFDEETA